MCASQNSVYILSTVDVVYKQRSPAGIQSPVQWNLKETAPPPVSSPSNILLPLSFHCSSIPAADIRRGSKMLFLNFLIKKNCISPKLCNLKLRKPRRFCSRCQNQVGKTKLIFTAVKTPKFNLGHTKSSVAYWLRALKTTSGNIARSRPRQIKFLNN